MRKLLGMFFLLSLAFGIKSTALAPRAPTLQQQVEPAGYVHGTARQYQIEYQVLYRHGEWGR